MSAQSLPRRRRHFASLTETDLRHIARRVIGDHADNAELILPEQGVNNRTYFVRQARGSDLVIKLRPGKKQPLQPIRRVSSPQWPRYTQELLGPVPNGNLSTLQQIADLLRCHGTLRVPDIYLVDDTQEQLASSYIVSEWLHGRPFGWHDFTPHAAMQIGEHLGHLHLGTGDKGGFGIFAGDGEFAAAAWWTRFARAYRVLSAELMRGSAQMEAIRTPLDSALAAAIETGTPQRFALACIDQNPQHYLRLEDGSIGGMVDIEAHLWAPAEYELAMVEMWVQDTHAFRRGYEQTLSWPATMEQVRPAYQFMTLMEWIYCLYTLMHRPEEAAHLERSLVEQCNAWLDRTARHAL